MLNNITIRLVALFSIVMIVFASLCSFILYWYQFNSKAKDITSHYFTQSKISIDKGYSDFSYVEYSFVSNIVNATTSWISTYGYAGVFSAALIENLFPPIPSEIIFPLAGFTAKSENMGLINGAMGMAFMGSLGSTLGAIIIYYISFHLGRPVVLKMGKYVGIGEKELEKTEKWFEKYGQIAIFLGRMIPGIRELISIPAGIERMKFSTFVVFTFMGSLVWCTFLTLIGYYTGEAWNKFYKEFSFIFEILAITMISGFIVGMAYKIYKYKRKQ